MNLWERYGALAIVLALIIAAVVIPMPKDDFQPMTVYRERLSIYEKADIVTGTSSVILRGIAFAESSYKANPKHPDPLDVGMFGLHESSEYHSERALKWFDYDATNPLEAAVITGYLYKENLRILKDADLAIAAHYQGPTGVLVNGPKLWYIERVKNAPRIRGM